MRTYSLASVAAKMSLVTCGLALFGGLWGCSGSGATEPQQTRRKAPAYVRPSNVQVDTPTVENTEERGEEIRKVCTRKAATSPDLGRCWMDEAERSGNRKLEANIRVMLYVSGQGAVQDATVLNAVPELAQMEKCVVDAVKGWSYPSGQTVVPVQCNFLLRSSQ